MAHLPPTAPASVPDATRRLRRGYAVAAFGTVTVLFVLIKMWTNGGHVSTTFYGPLAAAVAIVTVFRVRMLKSLAADYRTDHLIHTGVYARSVRRGLRRGALAGLAVGLVILFLFPNFGGSGNSGKSPHNPFGMGRPGITTSQVT